MRDLHQPPVTEITMTITRRPQWQVVLLSPVTFLRHYRALRQHNSRFASAYTAWSLTRQFVKLHRTVQEMMPDDR